MRKEKRPDSRRERTCSGASVIIVRIKLFLFSGWVFRYGTEYYVHRALRTGFVMYRS